MCKTESNTEVFCLGVSETKEEKSGAPLVPVDPAHEVHLEESRL